MSTLYVILGVIISAIVAFSAFVIIGAIEKHRHININWVMMVITIVLSCVLIMVLIYHSENDKEVAQTSYNNGYEDGVADTHHTIPTNSEMEEWFSSTQEVVVGTNGSDYAVHIIDGQGEEWVLYANKVVEK